MKYVLFLIFVCCFSENVTAGKADTVSIFSNSMNKYIKAVVIKPDSYKRKKNSFPVVYLLHGYDGWYSNWIIRVPELINYADHYQTIIVCPDGAKNSWYFDSPMDTAYRYETHIVEEVVHYIDKNYKTIADKNRRAITGLSMGGHGALFLALRHPDVFGAAGSISGGVDLKESKNRFEISGRIGDTLLQAGNWQKFSVINIIENHTNSGLKILIDCGDRDIFIEGNRRLHQKMQDLKIPHTYIERPGIHNWDYWSNAIPYQLLYFQQFFQLRGNQ
ncbi:MAG: esterase family protein [Chitinophagaceae bacterium]|nr:esterase family protein [Chitinophagaceae bacterium]